MPGHFVPSRWLRPLAPLKRLFPVNLPSANGLLKPVAASKSEFCAENNPPYDCSHTEDSLFYEPRPIGYFFVWRRERDSSGGTGAVPPPARGTKKTSTGRFFASLRSAVPFESLPLSLHKQKKHPYWVLFCLAQRKGFEPLLRFPVNTISSRAPSTSSAISASRSNIIQHFFVHCKRNLILRIKIV